MYQTWDKLLFMHWAVPASSLRPHIPDRLHIDTYDGTAWIGVTPFTMPDIRPTGLPSVPLVSRSHELNVRTYVHYDGVPGVWFFSLDASNPLAVWGARAGFGLPYYRAMMELDERGDRIRFVSRRSAASDVRFEADWTRGESLPPAEPVTQDFFLIERYCLYASRGDRLMRCRIHHDPWPLRTADLQAFSSTMLSAQGLPESDDPPLLHAQAAPLRVEVWMPEEI